MAVLKVVGALLFVALVAEVVVAAKRGPKVTDKVRRSESSFEHLLLFMSRSLHCFSRCSAGHLGFTKANIFAQKLKDLMRGLREERALGNCWDAAAK